MAQPLNPSHMPSVAQKHPNDRSSIWDYANPHLDASPVARSSDFPVTVYLPHDPADTNLKGQVDHPGWHAKSVEDAWALREARADGWTLTRADVQ